MIELNNDVLDFSFPEVHTKAKISINFQRTLRIPDDQTTYPLPPGLGTFPLKHVDDYKVPSTWIEHGGVMLPMYQSEAMWLNFKTHYVYDRKTDYPFAIKVATGKIDALTGKAWENSLNKKPQDYMVSTKQPWLDGYCVRKGTIRQFVAMPLGTGYSTEEQITEEAKHGGIQIIVYPMKREVFEKRFPIIKREPRAVFSKSSPVFSKTSKSSSYDMGLAPGGKMHQEIYNDPFDYHDWDLNSGSRCFVHITNSLVWRAITGDNSPTVPFTAKEYNDNGFPWFEYYDEKAVSIEGSSILGKLKSIFQKGNDKGESPLPENISVKPKNLKVMIKGNRVREGTF